MQLADACGLHLDPWQSYVLEHSLGRRADSTWAASSVGVIVPRQNGKGSILEARQLAGLLLFGEELILHSAHEFKTANESFLRMVQLMDGTDSIRKRVARFRFGSGEQAVEMLNGGRLKFVARSRGSGRGFSGDCIILDEAFEISPQVIAAMIPTLSARPNPQRWYTSSAPMVDSDVLHALRKRGLEGSDPRLAFFEWAADDDDDPLSPETWAKANPGYGIRIGDDAILDESREMTPELFARERLGIPETSTVATRPVPLEQWDACLHADSQPPARGLVAAVDLSPDRVSASIAIAGLNADGVTHVEILPPDPDGEADPVASLRKLDRQLHLTSLAANLSGPIGSYHRDLADAFGRRFHPLSDADMTKACGMFADAVRDGQLAHIGQPSLRMALEGAAKHKQGDAWRWSRVSSTVNISPLVAATEALWASLSAAHRPKASPARIY